MLKRAGLLTSVFLLTLWCASFVWIVRWDQTWSSSIVLGQGTLVAIWTDPAGTPLREIEIRCTGILAAPSYWLPEFMSIQLRGDLRKNLILPLWLPIVLVGLPTAWLSWRDRRRIPPGHCRKCGYNLTGNVSGVCPECGEKM
jgi:hypothetical protein